MLALLQRRVEVRPGDVWRYVRAFMIVAATSCVAEVLYRSFDTTRLSMVFLTGVLIASVTQGQGPGYFAAALSFVVYNIYLVEPRFIFSIDSPEDIIVLLVFAVVALLTGRLAGRVRDEAGRANARAETASALFEASRELSSIEDEPTIRRKLAVHIESAAKGEAAVWDAAGRRVSASGPAPSGSLLERARGFYLDPAMEHETYETDGWRFRPLRADGKDLGLAAWRSGRSNDALVEAKLVTVLADIGAAAIMRARLASARAEVEAAARTEQLRNALLSSISHDLRTPLAAILASASSLREFGGQFSEAVRSDLVATIEEEAERLNRLVANLLSMTRLESGALQVKTAPAPVSEVLDRLFAYAERRRGGRVLTRADEGGLEVRADPVLLEQALANVLENAIRFSADGTAIEVSARSDPRGVVLAVRDEGPGLDPGELGLIFEKFYRSPATPAELGGTGLGLSITQGLVEAMDGKVVAQNRDDGRSGLVVSLILPPRTA